MPCLTATPIRSMAAGAVVLSDERVDVRGDARRQADQHPVVHAAGQGRRRRLLRIPGQIQPVDEPHDRPEAALHDQRQRNRQHLAAAARPRPPVRPPAAGFAASARCWIRSERNDTHVSLLGEGASPARGQSASRGGTRPRLDQVRPMLKRPPQADVTS